MENTCIAATFCYIDGTSITKWEATKAKGSDFTGHRSLIDRSSVRGERFMGRD